MLNCPNNLIEEFATMLEQSNDLNDEKIAEKTFTLMMMLTFDPQLRPLMKDISIKLKSLLTHSDSLSNQDPSSANKFVAAQLRELKKPYH